MRFVALACDIAAIVAAWFFVAHRSPQQRALWCVTLLTVTAGFLVALNERFATAGYCVCAAAALLILMWAKGDRRGAARRWLRAASVAPIVLRPPFHGRWRVAAGGPDPRRNHHQAVSDQYFAYDFLREGGASWDEPVLAPCDGTVAHTEARRPDADPERANRDARKPFGNYVSIETAGGYVVLAHLRQASVCVRVGDAVTAGDVIGRCGNSGNTRGAHLHVHAQDRPAQAVGEARGVPVAFSDGVRPQPMLLEFGDVVSG